MPADQTILAEEVHVQSRHRYALIDPGHPKADDHPGPIVSHGLHLLGGDVGQGTERGLLARGDSRAHATHDTVDPNRMEQVAADEPILDSSGQPAEIQPLEMLALALPEGADVDERQSLVLAQKPRRGILGFPTTRGDRFFVSLLGTAYIFIIFLCTGGEVFWYPVAAAVLFAVAMFRLA